MLYKNLENYAETRRREGAPVGEQVRAMLEVVAEAAMAQTETQSMLALQDGDTTGTTRGAKVQRTDGDGFEVGKNPVTESHSKKITEDQSDKILQQMTLLFESVKLLGTRMTEGFETERIRKKEDFSYLEKKNACENGRIQERRKCKTAASKMK